MLRQPTFPRSYNISLPRHSTFIKRDWTIRSHFPIFQTHVVAIAAYSLVGAISRFGPKSNRGNRLDSLRRAWEVVEAQSVLETPFINKMVAYSSITADGNGESSSSNSGRGRRNRRSHVKEGYVGEASWLSSNINLVNTIIGAGTLAMPRAFSQMGMTLGTLFILWSGMTAGFGLYLQTLCARYLDRGSASFFALSQMTYPNAAVVFDTAIAIKCFGVGVSYLIIIGDLMPGVVRGFNDNIGDNAPFMVDRHFWVTAFMLVVIPLSFLRRLDSLKYTSVVALVSIGYLIVLVVYHFFKGDTMAERGELRYVQWAGAKEALSTLPVIVFAYTCHQNMFSILNEVKDNSPKRTTGIVGASIGTAAFVYVLVAFTGYLSFGNDVKGNIIGMCKGILLDIGPL